MNMLLDLSRFRSGLDQVVRQFEPSEFGDTDNEFRVVEPVSLDVKVHKDAQKVRLVGRVTTMLTTDCSRCLEPFRVPVNAEFDSLFLPFTEQTGEAEQEVVSEDLGVSVYRNDTIDLGDVMREQFYLALPMKPLCTPDCRGLCPVCGVNRNRESCTCQAEWVDPRLEALKRFLPTDAADE